MGHAKIKHFLEYQYEKVEYSKSIVPNLFHTHYFQNIQIKFNCIQSSKLTEISHHTNHFLSKMS